MPASAVRFALTCGLCLTALVACSGAPDRDPAASGDVLADTRPEDPAADETPVNEEERRAARQLSLGSGAVIDTDSSPYEQALRCRTAVEAVGQRFRSAGAQGEAQSRAIAQATTILDQRLRAQAVLVNKNDAAIRRELNQAVRAVEDLPAEGQLMIACLQQLQ